MDNFSMFIRQICRYQTQLEQIMVGIVTDNVEFVHLNLQILNINT